MYYHVEMWQRFGGDLLMRSSNLEWALIRDRVLPAYRNGNILTLDGSTVATISIGRIRILETDDEVDPIAPYHDDYLRALGYSYSTGERDVTNQWIVGPPGHAAEEATSIKTETPTWNGLFDALITNPEMRSASRQLFIDGHYQNAVEDAFKAIDQAVAKRSRIAESGTSLMRKAFGGESPVIALTRLETEPEKRVQDGYNHLFAGSMQAIRNPRAHGLAIDQPDEALELIVWAHHLMRILCSATDFETALQVTSP